MAGIGLLNHAAEKTGNSEMATSGGVAILIPPHREELQHRTMAVQIAMGQTPLALCCIYPQVDPTEIQAERELELLSNWIIPDMAADT
eukprot:1793315-Amphidinium_carterae.4